MKLPIKHKYFEQIKNGSKLVELREAHITFIDEETGEELRKELLTCGIGFREDVIEMAQVSEEDAKEMFKDDKLIFFGLED